MKNDRTIKDNIRRSNVVSPEEAIQLDYLVARKVYELGWITKKEYEMIIKHYDSEEQEKARR